MTKQEFQDFLVEKRLLYKECCFRVLSFEGVQETRYFQLYVKDLTNRRAAIFVSNHNLRDAAIAAMDNYTRYIHEIKKAYFDRAEERKKQRR